MCPACSHWPDVATARPSTATTAASSSTSSGVPDSHPPQAVEGEATAREDVAAGVDAEVDRSSRHEPLRGTGHGPALHEPGRVDQQGGRRSSRESCARGPCTALAPRRPRAGSRQAQLAPVEPADVAVFAVGAEDGVDLPPTPRSVQISSSAEPILQQEALTKKSAAIDAVSGATFTSASYMQSLQSDLDKLGFKAPTARAPPAGPVADDAPAIPPRKPPLRDAFQCAEEGSNFHPVMPDQALNLAEYPRDTRPRLIVGAADRFTRLRIRSESADMAARLRRSQPAARVPVRQTMPSVVRSEVRFTDAGRSSSCRRRPRPPMGCSSWISAPSHVLTRTRVS
jgi:hypothetical protein